MHSAAQGTENQLEPIVHILGRTAYLQETPIIRPSLLCCAVCFGCIMLPGSSNLENLLSFDSAARSNQAMLP